MAGKIRTINLLLGSLFLALSSSTPAFCYSYNELVLMVQAEERVFGKASYSLSLDERLNQLETSVLGRHLSGSDSYRLRSVCKNLGISMPEGAGLAAPVEVVIKRESSTDRSLSRETKRSYSNPSSRKRKRSAGQQLPHEPKLEATNLPIESAARAESALSTDATQVSESLPGELTPQDQQIQNSRTDAQLSGRSVKVEEMLLGAAVLLAVLTATGLIFLWRGQDEQALDSRRLIRRKKVNRAGQAVDEYSAADFMPELASNPVLGQIEQAGEPSPYEAKIIEVSFAESAIHSPSAFEDSEENFDVTPQSLSTGYASAEAEGSTPLVESDLAASQEPEISEITSTNGPEPGFEIREQTNVISLLDSMHFENFRFDEEEFLASINFTPEAAESQNTETPTYTEPLLLSSPPSAPILSSEFAGLIFGFEDQSGEDEPEKTDDNGDAYFQSWPLQEAEQAPRISTVSSFRNGNELKKHSSSGETADDWEPDFYHALAEVLVNMAVGENTKQVVETGINTVAFPAQSRLQKNTAEYQFCLRNLFSEKTIA